MPKKKSTSSNKVPAPADPTQFESAIAEIETIVTKMESENLPLAELIDKYQRGTELLETCQKIISNARAKIEAIELSATSTRLIPLENDTNQPDDNDTVD